MKSRIDSKQTLAGLAPFQALSAAARDRLALRASVVDAPRGTIVVQPGDPCNGFHVVVSGQIKLSLRKSASEEKVIELLAPGDTFGEPAMFAGTPYRVCAEALTHSELLHVPRESMLEEIRREPAFACATLERLSQRLGALLDDVESCTLLSGTERVAAYLLRQTRGAGRAEPFVFPARKRVIASQLNLTQEHFSRILRDLIAADAIEVQGRIVRIVDKVRLHALTAAPAR